MQSLKTDKSTQEETDIPFVEIYEYETKEIDLSKKWNPFLSFEVKKTALRWAKAVSKIEEMGLNHLRSLEGKPIDECLEEIAVGYIITLFCIKNGQKRSILKNLRVSDITDALLECGYFIVRVTKLAVPIQIALSPTEISIVKEYINYIRPQIAKRYVKLKENLLIPFAEEGICKYFNRFLANNHVDLNCAEAHKVLTTPKLNGLMNVNSMILDNYLFPEEDYHPAFAVEAGELIEFMLKSWNTSKEGVTKIGDSAYIEEHEYDMSGKSQTASNVSRSKRKLDVGDLPKEKKQKVSMDRSQLVEKLLTMYPNIEVPEIRLTLRKIAPFVPDGDKQIARSIKHAYGYRIKKIRTKAVVSFLDGKLGRATMLDDLTQEVIGQILNEMGFMIYRPGLKFVKSFIIAREWKHQIQLKNLKKLTTKGKCGREFQCINPENYMQRIATT